MNEFFKHDSVRFLEVPDPSRHEWHTKSGDAQVITFNLYMETVTSLIYSRFSQYQFLSLIGATPLTVLGYCTYRFWSEEIQASMGHMHDDIWCVIEEDIGNLLDGGCGVFTSQDQDKAQAYLQAIEQLVREVYPFFREVLDGFMKQNRLYGIEDLDLDVAGVMGYVVNFTILKPTVGI